MADWLEVYQSRAEILGYVPETLCELCGRACGRCRWSRKDVQLPVKGWVAVRRDVPMTDSQGKVHWEESYVVLECPEYELELRHWWYYLNFDRELARHLAEMSWEERYG